MSTAHLAIDAGPSCGCVAIGWPSTCQRPPYLVVVRAWERPEDVPAAQDWVRRMLGSLPYRLAPEWTCERPFVTSNRPAAGAAQWASLEDWAHLAGELGARLTHVDGRSWREPFGIPSSDPAPAARSWLTLLYPGLQLGERDHTSDAVRGVLVALPGGAAWAQAELAAAVTAGRPEALAVVAACSRRKRKAKGKRAGAGGNPADITPERAARLTGDVREYLERRAAAGDARAVRALATWGG
jgi:hypothetical protein